MYRESYLSQPFRYRSRVFGTKITIISSNFCCAFHAFSSWRTKKHAAGSNGSVGGSHSSGGSGGGSWFSSVFRAFSSWRTNKQAAGSSGSVGGSHSTAAAVTAADTAAAVGGLLVCPPR